MINEKYIKKKTAEELKSKKQKNKTNKIIE